jgi:periplasmic protein TonB
MGTEGLKIVQRRVLRSFVVCFGLFLVTSCISTEGRHEIYRKYMQTVVAQLEKEGRYADWTSIGATKLAAKVDLAITPDGSLEAVRIVQSSGNSEFDRAVVRIAYAAAPFLPFPEEIRKEIDILHIVRTWRYYPSKQ